jgi:hypothetical protein
MRINSVTLAVSAMAVAALGLVAVAQQKASSASTATLPMVTVYKTSSCGCCRLWVDHMKANGFQVQAMDVSSADVRNVSKMAGLKDEDTSCHTAKVGNYIVEGHVPADDIKRMLRDKPAIAGIAAPGMPQGSPGMEQGTKEPYNVIAFKKDGTSTVFASHK